MSDGFIIYKSQVESIAVLPAEDFKQCIMALTDYATEGIQYEGTNPLVVMYMTLVVPNVDANAKRRENGKKGGRPRKQEDEEETAAEPLKKQEEQHAEVEAIPLNDGTEWKPTQAEYEEYVRLFPNLDIQMKFREMRAWCNANDSRRKTRRGVKRFVNGWLSNDRKTKVNGRSVPASDYIVQQMNGTLPKGKEASEELKERVRRLQEGI